MQILTQLLSAVTLLASVLAIDITISTTRPEQPLTTINPKGSSSFNSTCEARTINYITHRLPQQCLKSAWTSLDDPVLKTDEHVPTLSGASEASLSPTEATQSKSSQVISVTTIIEPPTHSNGDQTSSSSTPSTGSIVPSGSPEALDDIQDEEESALDDASFLSFEDWKRQNLENSGQSSQHVGNRKTPANPGNQEHTHQNGIDNVFDSLGDDGEIALDFGVFGRNESKDSQPAATSRPSHESNTNDKIEQPRPEARRSKDAGTTCKERSNFVSADCGAAVLNSNTQAKSAKAVLTENKDSYLLNECSASNKFLIVEMCDDILVDTIVLANFEFFSSQFRQFRVSVSDRYPVKFDKWKDIGTFEARNTRGTQAFAVTEPRIWARYIRIEFLSHYGNEYYCPVSVLRVHGTTMISEFRAEAAGGDDDVDEDLEFLQQETTESSSASGNLQDGHKQQVAEELKEAQLAIEELVQTAEQLSSEIFHKTLHSNHMEEISQLLQNASSASMTTSWHRPGLDKLTCTEASPLNICLLSEAPQPAVSNQSAVSDSDKETTNSTLDMIRTSEGPSTSGSMSAFGVNQPLHGSPVIEKSSSMSPTPDKASDDCTKTAANLKETASLISSSLSAKLTNTTSSSTSKSASTSTSSTSPSPSTQESFFKTVHRRLQLLEANSTLSLKYIEEQSKILRDAFVKVERRQLDKTTTFLENLNSTVLAELHVFRQQYDQIWQSTVIELETQRDQSQREILAVSARLTLLADEVIFQKRMSIVQSVLLLLCLGLVIFSRGFAGSYVDFPMGRSRSSAFLRFGSPPESPGQIRSDSQDEDEKRYHIHNNRTARSTLNSTTFRDNLSPISASSPTSDDDPLYTDAHRVPCVRARKDTSELGMETSNDVPTQVFHASSRSGEERDMHLSKTYHRKNSEYPNYLESDDFFDGQEYDEGHGRLDGNFEAGSIDNAFDFDEPRNEQMEVDCAGLPSPPPEGETSSFVIARKPLPALPHE